MKTGSIFLSAMILSVVQNAASAEDFLKADTPKLDTRPPVKRAPLNGKVSVDAEHHAPIAKAPATVTKAPAPVAVKPVAKPPQAIAAVPPRVMPNQTPPLNGFANQFGGMPMQGMMDRHNRHFMHGQAMMNPYALQAMQQQAQKPKWTNPDDAPYKWGQCPTGGYADMTGTYKGPPVWGDKLGAYGGHFFDGTPVPKGPVQINSYGHIWWQNSLSGHFVNKSDMHRLGFDNL
ncbi:MAG TPA: hypothetical protein V6C76_04105 [Drouetiella sp.]